MGLPRWKRACECCAARNCESHAFQLHGLHLNYCTACGQHPRHAHSVRDQTHTTDMKSACCTLCRQYLGTSRGQKRRAHSPVPHEPTEAPHPKRSCSVLDRLGQSRSRVAGALRPSSQDPSADSPSLQAWDPAGQDSTPLLSPTLRSRLGGPARVRGIGTPASEHARGPAPGKHAVAAAPSGPQASRPTVAVLGLQPAVPQGRLRGSGRGTDLRQQLSARAAAAADRGSSRKARQGAAAAVKLEGEESDNEDDSSLGAEGPGARMEHRLHSCGGVELQVRQQAPGEEVSPTRCHSLGPGQLSERLRHRLGHQCAEALCHHAAGRDSSPRHRAAGRDVAGRESSLLRQTARRDLGPCGRDPSPRRRADTDHSPVCGDQEGQKRHREATGTDPGPRGRAHCSPSLDREESPGQLAASGDSLKRRGGHGVLQRLGGRGAAAQGGTARAGGRQAAYGQQGWQTAEEERLHRVRDRHAAKGPGRRHAAAEDSPYRAKHRHAADGVRQARDHAAHMRPPAAAAGKAAGAKDLGLQAESSLVEALRQALAAKPAAPSGTASAAMSGPSSTVLSEQVASADVELPEVTSHFMSRAATAGQQTAGSGKGRPNSSVVSAATLHPRASTACRGGGNSAAGGNNNCSDDLGGLVQGMYADRIPGPRSLAHRLGLPVRI